MLDSTMAQKARSNKKNNQISSHQSIEKNRMVFCLVYENLDFFSND